MLHTFGLDKILFKTFTTFNDLKSSFSNYNAGLFAWVDIASPGGYTFSGLLSTVYTSSGNSYAKFGGTSMAALFAAGLVG